MKTLLVLLLLSSVASADLYEALVDPTKRQTLGPAVSGCSAPRSATQKFGEHVRRDLTELRKAITPA